MNTMQEMPWQREGPLGIICHDGEELLLVDFAVLVEIELVYHRLTGWKTGFSEHSPQAYSECLNNE